MDVASLNMMPSEYINLQNSEIDSLISEFNYNLSSIHNSHSEKIELINNKTPLSENIKKNFQNKIQMATRFEKNISPHGQQGFLRI